MNQDKLYMINQEMERLNIDIIRLSELKWMGKGKFNLDDQYMNYYERESLKKWNSPHSQQETKIHTKKRCPFHHSRMEYKKRKLRDTQNNRQVWPCTFLSTK